MKYNTDKKDEKGQVIVEIDGQKYPLSYESTRSAATISIGQIKLGEGDHQLKLSPVDRGRDRLFFHDRSIFHKLFMAGSARNNSEMAITGEEYFCALNNDRRA